MFIYTYIYICICTGGAAFPCSFHGACSPAGTCDCFSGWAGAACEAKVSTVEKVNFPSKSST